MIQIQIQLNLANATEYFRDHLTVGDYYAENEKIAAHWIGAGAHQLGLTGLVNESAFLALCHGDHPTSGEPLLQRRNTVRQVGNLTVINRRIFYDFAIAPPKSVSVAALLGDDRILSAHDRAVRVAMLELEGYAETRLRTGRQNGARRTKNIVAALFRHQTSRELDPQLHTHCVVFNTTFDSVETRWKALQVEAMYRAQRYATNVYRHELCRDLRELGYEILSSRNGFEIKGVPPSVIERFSKRHHQINRETVRRLKMGSDAGNLAELRKAVARGTRKRKQTEPPQAQLRAFWLRQLTAEEQSSLSALPSTAIDPAPKYPLTQAFDWAEQHLFERRSLIAERELKSAVLERARGEAFTLTQLHEESLQRPLIRESGTDRVTLREVLDREWAIVSAARDGRKRYAPFHPGYAPSASLNDEQRKALDHLLNSRDFITLFRGGAGTGKTHTLRELKAGLEAAGCPLVALAPQRQQVLDLTAGGLPAETLATFLLRSSVPNRAVIILDEAGQVGGRDLYALIELAQSQHGRLILSGDTRQHGAVAASDALRAIEKHAGLPAAQLTRIVRQDPSAGKRSRERREIRAYRRAVAAAAKGRVLASFDRLHRLGWIQETPASDYDATLAKAYLTTTHSAAQVLVVTQTRAHAARSNDIIREALKAHGQLGLERDHLAFTPIDLTEAQKADVRSYTSDLRVLFIQRYGRYRRGELYPIKSISARGLTLEKGGRVSTIGFQHAARWSVVSENRLALSIGDRLQLRQNGLSREGRPFANGEIVTVTRHLAHGSVRVRGGNGSTRTLDAHQLILTRGYAVTSYASQGKTVDVVILADAGATPATSSNQWYVSISRGRRQVRIITTDRDALRARIETQEARPLALEILPQSPAERQLHHAAVMNRIKAVNQYRH